MRHCWLAHARTWDIVTEVVTVESFRHLREDLESIGRAAYVCELVDSFTEEEDENQPLWDLLLLALREIDEASARLDRQRADVLLRWFELHLLSLTGFQPELFACLECGRPLEPVTNYLILAEGGVICPQCQAKAQGSGANRRRCSQSAALLQSRPWDGGSDPWSCGRPSC